MLKVPTRRLDLHHVDMDDPAVRVPHPPPLLVKCPAGLALESPLACVEASCMWVEGRAGEQEWVGFDRRVDASLIPIDVDLTVSPTRERWTYGLIEVPRDLLDDVLPAKAPHIEEEDRVRGVETHLLQEILQDGFLRNQRNVTVTAIHVRPTRSGISPVPNMAPVSR
jgi:hypothetical protein